MIRLIQSRILLVWPIGNANGIWRVHSAIQHSDLIDDGSLQERPLLHQSHRLVQLILEIIVATVATRHAIICIVVPTNVSRATARNVLTFGACVRNETVNVVQVHCNKWGGQVFVALGNGNRCSFLPHADLSCNTLGVAPAIWQRLRVIDPGHWPEANPCGMTVCPAIAVSLLIWFGSALITKQMRNRTVPCLNFSVRTWRRASSHHATHTAALDVGLICT